MGKNKYCVSLRLNDGTLKCNDVIAESEEEAIDKYINSKEFVDYVNANQNSKEFPDGVSIVSAKAVITV